MGVFNGRCGGRGGDGFIAAAWRPLKEESNRSSECSTKRDANENERWGIVVLEQLDGHGLFEN